MEAMTLAQVRDELRELAFNPPKNVWKRMFNLADAIDAHLAQPAQAVDVGVVRDVVKQMEATGYLSSPYVQSWALQLTRAISGEKAGPVGDGWQPTDDDVRAWMNRNDITELSVYDSRTAIEDARIMHNFNVLPASPTPGKEEQP